MGIKEQKQKQKLIDIMFETGLQIHNHPWFKGKSNEEVAGWIKETLDKTGFKVVSMGASWGVLKEE